jgi:DNA-directed RNA polymerase subunit K/omega
MQLQKPKELERLTKYEKARAISVAATQIQHGMPHDSQEKDSISIAKEQLKLGKLPMFIKRNHPSGETTDKTIQELLEKKND